MDSMTGLSIVSTSHAHAHPHMTTHIRIRMDIGSSSERTEHSRGGHPCSLRPRRRETSADAPQFLKALFTHRISRSCPRPPTFSPFSPVPPPPPRLPAQRQTHTLSCPRGHSIPPAANAIQPRRLLRGPRPSDTRTPSSVQVAVQSNTTCARSTLCGRPCSCASACIACGSRGYSGSDLM